MKNTKSPKLSEEKLHDIMGDFMVDLCEQKRRGETGVEREHICQPNKELWSKNYKKFEALLASVRSDTLKEMREGLRPRIFKLRKDNPQYSLGQTNGHYIAIDEVLSLIKEMEL